MRRCSFWEVLVYVISDSIVVEGWLTWVPDSTSGFRIDVRVFVVAILGAIIVHEEVNKHYGFGLTFLSLSISFSLFPSNSAPTTTLRPTQFNVAFAYSKTGALSLIARPRAYQLLRGIRI